MCIHLGQACALDLPVWRNMCCGSGGGALALARLALCGRRNGNTGMPLRSLGKAGCSLGDRELSLVPLAKLWT